MKKEYKKFIILEAIILIIILIIIISQCDFKGGQKNQNELSNTIEKIDVTKENDDINNSQALNQKEVSNNIK